MVPTLGNVIELQKIEGSWMISLNIMNCMLMTIFCEIGIAIELNDCLDDFLRLTLQV